MDHTPRAGQQREPSSAEIAEAREQLHYLLCTELDRPIERSKAAELLDQLLDDIAPFPEPGDVNRRPWLITAPADMARLDATLNDPSASADDRREATKKLSLLGMQVEYVLAGVRLAARLVTRDRE